MRYRCCRGCAIESTSPPVQGTTLRSARAITLLLQRAKNLSHTRRAPPWSFFPSAPTPRDAAAAQPPALVTSSSSGRSLRRPSMSAVRAARKSGLKSLSLALLSGGRKLALYLPRKLCPGGRCGHKAQGRPAVCGHSPGQAKDRRAAWEAMSGRPGQGRPVLPTSLCTSRSPPCPSRPPGTARRRRSPPA